MTNDKPGAMRLLITPLGNPNLFRQVEAALEDAVRRYPDNWEKVVDEPATIDHIGYHDGTLSAVVWSLEPGTIFHRLSLRPGRHEVFDNLLALVLDYYSVTEED